MVTRKRKSLDNVLHDFQQFMYYRSQKSTAEGMFTKIGNKLKKYLDENGTELTDDAGKPGNIVYKFARPVYIGEKGYTGFEKRRTDPSPAFDEDAALKLAGEKDIPLATVTTDVTITIPVTQFQELSATFPAGATWSDFRAEITFDVDQNAFYRLYQLGKITEEEIDSLLVLPEGAKPSYKFWPMEASGEDLEDDE